MAVKADIDFQKDLFDAATRMRGSITPSDYKHYVLPLIFLRYVSLRFDKRRAQVEVMERLMTSPVVILPYPTLRRTVSQVKVKQKFEITI